MKSKFLTEDVSILEAGTSILLVGTAFPLSTPLPTATGTNPKQKQALVIDYTPRDLGAWRHSRASTGYSGWLLCPT